MSSGPLVSIITPCFNGEKIISRLLDSILIQTYRNIELILVNDGSNDNTEQIVLSYKDKLEKYGIQFIYVYQANQGVGSAINAGLKKVTGKYFCWPDFDDYFDSESVEQRVRILEEFPEFGIVASDAYLRSEDDLSNPYGLVSSPYRKNDDPEQFIHLLSGKSFICSGSYMVRTKAFLETHPTGKIFPSRRGQNYQILMPVYYKYKRYFLNKPLYNYIRRRSSLSMVEGNGFHEKIETYNSQREIILNTLSAIKMPDIERSLYNNIVNYRYSGLILNTAYNNRDFELVIKEYKNIRKLKKLSFKLLLRFIIARVSLMRSNKLN
jgi:glycosyltransferase involved in cell wall biosynthesis